jgi:hypothetical protein
MGESEALKRAIREPFAARFDEVNVPESIVNLEPDTICPVTLVLLHSTWYEPSLPGQHFQGFGSGRLEDFTMNSGIVNLKTTTWRSQYFPLTTDNFTS